MASRRRFAVGGQCRAPGSQYLTSRLLDQWCDLRIFRQFTGAQTDHFSWIEWQLLARYQRSEAEGELPFLGSAKDIASRYGGGERDLLTVFH